MKKELKTAMKEAMKAKDSLRLTTIRSLLAAFQYTEMEKGVDEISEKDAVAILKREAKKRREEMDFAQKAERTEAIADLEKELEVIKSFLPTQLSEPQLEEILSKAKTDGEANDLGSAMKYLSANYNGQYDGKAASSVARKVFT